MIEHSELVEALGENDARIYDYLHTQLELGFMTPEYYHGGCVEYPDGWIPAYGSVESQDADCRDGWLVRLSALFDCLPVDTWIALTGTGRALQAKPRSYQRQTAKVMSP